MQIYWRIQQDLNTMGETIRFHDPSLVRSLRTWVRKNFAGLAMAEGWGASPVLGRGRN